MSNYYIRLCKGLSDKGALVPADSNLIKLTTRNDSWYRSLFLYNEEQKEQFIKTGSVAGITDTVTDYLYFDFDSATDLTLAKQDTETLIKRLTDLQATKAIKVFFSGKKGFSVELELENIITNTEYKQLYKNLTSGLRTADKVVVNPSRIIRVMLTKHEGSGLYKVPILLEDFKNMSIDDIKEYAKSLDNVPPPDEFKWSKIHSILFIGTTPQEEIEPPKNEKLSLSIETLDFSKKPKYLDPARWALQNGFFVEGERSIALTCLAATYKNQGFDIEHTYRFLKGVAQLQSKRTGEKRFPDREIYNNIILQVYGPNWKGGQYSLTDKTGWLYQYAERMGLLNEIKKEATYEPQTLLSVRDEFKDYVSNIEQNTIKTGIESLDNKVFLSTGANVYLVAGPGVGKTSFTLNVLENTSKAGIKSVFASLDMRRSRLFEKVMYRISGMNREDLYNTFKENKEAELMKELGERYGNVYFYDRSAPTIQDVRDYIINCEQQSGEKVKLVMIDYFERVLADKEEETAASKQIAGEIQDLVNDLNVCCITLVQPNKQSLVGDQSTPLLSYTSIKGSAMIQQSARIVLSMWRPFYNVQYSENDRYLSMGVLKNDFGEIGQLDFAWSGKQGQISELTEFDKEELKTLLEMKKAGIEQQQSTLAERFRRNA